MAVLPNKTDEEIGDEVSKILSDLIKIDTTNPPGNEIKAAEYLYNLFQKEGYEGEIIETGEGRGNYILRIPGKKSGKNLMLLGHLDVVPAQKDKWTVDPFSGEIKDGFVWGRGALDCKGLVAIQAWTVLNIIRNGLQRTHGDLIFAATADEERGGSHGVKWLVENNLDFKKVDYVITEGSGFCIPIAGKNKYLIEVGQKETFWVKLRVKGKPGHGSLPGFHKTAITKIAEIIKRIEKYSTPVEYSPTVKEILDELLEDNKLLKLLLLQKGLAGMVLKKMHKKRPSEATFLNSLLRDTITPTIIRGGYKENVIPEEAEVTLDARLLPGKKFEDLLDHLKHALGEKLLKKIEITKITGSEGPNFSEYRGNPFYAAIEHILKELDPKSKLVPFVISGGTDSRFLRKHGVTAYGFQPMTRDLKMSEILKMVHGIDEKVPIKTLIFGAKFMHALALYELQ